MVATDRLSTGDLVQCFSIIPGGYGHEHLGKVTTIKHVHSYGYGTLVTYELNGIPHKWHRRELLLLTQTNQFKEKSMQDSCAQQPQLVPGNPRSVTGRLRNLRLSKDDRLLKEYGLTFDNGSLTTTGKDALFDILLVAHKDELVEAVKALKTEDKAKK